MFMKRVRNLIPVYYKIAKELEEKGRGILTLINQHKSGK